MRSYRDLLIKKGFNCDYQKLDEQKKTDNYEKTLKLFIKQNKIKKLKIRHKKTNKLEASKSRTSTDGLTRVGGTSLIEFGGPKPLKLKPLHSSLTPKGHERLHE